MAIAFRSKAQNKGSTAAAASVTVTAPANIADDDLLVAFGFYHNSNGVSTDPLITAPTDWTLLDAISETTDTATGRFGAVWIKKALGMHLLYMPMWWLCASKQCRC